MYPSSCSRHLQVSPNEAQANANQVIVTNHYTDEAHFTNAVWLRLEHTTLLWGFDNSPMPSKYDHSGPHTRFVKLQVAHAPGMPGTFSLPLITKGKPLVSDPGMHHGTCVTHVSWCMSGSLTRGGGEKRSWHSRRMRNPQFNISGKRPMHIQICLQSSYDNLELVFFFWKGVWTDRVSMKYRWINQNI